VAVTDLVFIVIFVLAWIKEAYHVVVLGNAPYVRSSKKLVRQTLQAVEIKEGSIVYELGCGDARFLRELVKRKKVTAIGYEYFVFPYLTARLFNFFAPDKIKLYCQDFFKADLSRADYIFCYLLPKQMERLEKKLQQELKPGAIVISHAFSFKNWPLKKTIDIQTRKNKILNNRINIYQK
jgi:SAM-dependent methyltransferase